ncbi:hypothetical protein C8A00DRAFT_18122 [Chaetomidium leptoderma]|uniref:Molybdate-anion transporter n=1 Tax=Chaetomidium leptoderma TaxID=669021 RepID=A0AAN6VF44_9PEZI|nr:hypothetical protein C8A00DRAFT_18122 [Chaetomidium leptoderma]
MEIYTLNLLLLLTLSLALFFSTQHNRNPPITTTTTKNNKKNLTPFLLAYTLAMASDWLQGPFLYPLYQHTHHLPASLIPSLFTTGFVSSALSSGLVGRWADRYGRKRACLAFCGVYALSCVLTTGVVGGGGGGDSETLLMGGLVLGRVLGGVGTGLLFVGFESWVVGFLSTHSGEEEEGGLGRVLGVMSGLNSVVAVVCGVGSEAVVRAAGTRKAPFWVATGVLGLAGGVIWWFWDENYGETAAGAKNEKGDKTRSSVWVVLSNPQVLALGAASTVFEGSMYLFVFFWSPALKSVQSSEGELPYGVIFASFMAATLASSLAFNMITERQLMRHTSLLVAILGVSAACFFLSATPGTEQSVFWVFCLFEAAVGMYWPCMGYLKGRLVDDGVRAQVYGILRIPLNVFVVVSLLFTGDGNGHGKVFSVCAGLLLASSGAVWAVMEGQASS